MAKNSATGHRGTNGWDVAARIVAALPANYLLTSIVTACLARLLPMHPGEASVAATLFSFALFAVIALIAFGGRSLAGLWLWMVGIGAAASGFLWLSLMVGGRL